MEQTARHNNLEEFLGAILRGAAKILGCNSTNLILINERTDEIRIILGAMAVSYPVLGQIEQVLGNSLQVISLPVRSIRDSLVYRAWRDCSIRETSSLSELVEGAFASEVTEQVAQLAGDHRFICVPALSGARNYGVLLFTKEGLHPFSRQQRELLLSYARRIGEIVENDLMGQGPSLIAPSTEGPDHLIVDAAGATVRHSGGELARQVLAREEGRLTARVIAFLAGERVEEQIEGSALGLAPELSLRLSRLQTSSVSRVGGSAQRCGAASAPGETSVSRVGGTDWALVALRQRRPARGGSLENQLLQLTLGEAAPALFIDPELRITSCNEATEQLFGYSAGELLQRPVDRLFCAPGEILAILRHQVDDPATPYAEEATTIVRRDGSVCPARIEALCLADELRQVAGFLVLVREAAVGDKAADRLMVQERLASMGELTTQLAHEIRNPLLAIGATLQGLVQESADDGQREILQTLSREINRMDMILKDYLAARHEISFSEVNLSEVVDDARRLLEGAHKLAGKTISAKIDPQVTILADYDALKHVLFNLLLNALEASPPCGEVRFALSLGEHDVSVFVEDRGPGLGAPATDCLRPFFTTKKNGTGLGLAVCQKIARAHGGTVELRERQGGGCQARLILPRRGRSSGQSEGASAR
jgi:PAS domain S-box-containing protein